MTYARMQQRNNFAIKSSEWIQQLLRTEKKPFKAAENLHECYVQSPFIVYFSVVYFPLQFKGHTGFARCSCNLSSVTISSILRQFSASHLGLSSHRSARVNKGILQQSEHVLDMLIFKLNKIQLLLSYHFDFGL